MKNFKKVLALVLALSMVLSSFTAFAAEAVDSGATLQTLGILVGDGTDLNEEGTLTREESMVIVLKLMGIMEVEPAAPTFTDVPADSWAAPWIAKAEELGVTAGMGDGTFGLGQELTTQQATALVLNVLGYDSTETYTKASELGLAAGLIDATDIVAFAEPVKRGDVFDVVAASLKANTEAGEGDMLIEKLVADEVVTEDVALELGLIENVEFAVKSVEAINLVQFEVKFTAPVDEDSATDLDNYEADGVDLKDADAELVADDTVVVTLDLTDNYSQQVEAEITVKDVKDLEEVKIEEFKTDVEFKDSTYPEVVGAEVVGNNAIEVSFSEPLDVDGLTNSDMKKAFELRNADDEKEYVDDVTFQADHKVALVTFNVGDGFEEEAYTLKVLPKLDDFAGFTYLTEDFSFDVVEDTEAPYVVDYKDVKLTEVTLVFNEPLNEAPDKDDVYHTNSNSSNKAKTVVFGDSKSELVVTFEDNSKLSTGYAYVFIDSESIEDLWENENEQTIRVEIEVPGDDVKPELEKVTVEEDYKTLTLEFTEDLDTASATDKDSYTLVDDDDDEIGIKSRTLSDDEVTLVLREELDEETEYTLTIEDVEDVYGNEIKKVEYKFTPSDVKVPVIDNFTAKLFEDDTDQTLVIFFGEEMDTSDDEDSVLNLKNYRVLMSEYDDDVPGDWKTAEFMLLSDIDDISIDAIDDGESVEISLDTDDGYKFVIDGGTDKEIQMAKVKDASGNESDELSGEYDVVLGAGNLSMVAGSFKVKDDVTAKFEVDGILEDIDEDEFDVEIYDVLGTSVLDTLDVDDYDLDIERDGDDTVVTFTLEDDDEYSFATNGDLRELDSDGLPLAGKIGKLRISTDNVQDTEDKFGNELSISNAVAVDDYAPELDSVVVSAHATTGMPVIKAVFTEYIKDQTSEKYYGTDLKIELGSDELSASDYAEIVVGPNEDFIEITVTNEDYAWFEGDVTVEVIDNTYICDTSDNEVKTGTEKDDEYTLDDDDAVLVAKHTFTEANADFLNGNASETEVKTDLDNTWTDNGVTYEITASANGAVSTSGVVTRPAYDPAGGVDVTGNVTVTFTKGTDSETKPVPVTVLALDPVSATLDVTHADFSTGTVDATGETVVVTDEEGNTTNVLLSALTVANQTVLADDVDITTNTDDGNETVAITGGGSITISNPEASDVAEFDITVTDGDGNEITVTVTATDN